MRRKAFISLAALLALLAGSACTRQDPLPTGEVKLTFSVGQPETRAITPGITGPADGGAIFCTGAGTQADPYVPDLHIFIADSEGDIVARYPGLTASCDVNAANTQATVSFSGMTAGEYTVYAIANTNGGVWGAPADQDAWNAILTREDPEDPAPATVLESLTLNHGSDPQPVVSDRMPLSASGTLTVQATGNGEVSLELLRCVAGVKVQFENATSGALVLGDSEDDNKNVSVSIGSINPTSGKLIPPASGDDVSGDLQTLTMSASSLTIPKGGTALLSASTYFVFPSVAPGGTYYCHPVTFSWTQTTPSSGDPVVTSGSYTSEAPGLRIHDKKSADIPSLLRNQLITIQIRIANNSDVSFNFVVTDWDKKQERVWFD